MPLEQLNLDPNAAYHAFDVWEEKYLGVVSGKLPCRKLDLGCCQIVALRKVQDVPQFLASTRHVSMDAVSVRSANWKDGKLSVVLQGQPGMSAVYYFAAPEGCEFKRIEMTGGGYDCVSVDDAKGKDTAGRNILRESLI